MIDSIQKANDLIFRKGRHIDFDVYNLAQSYFYLPKITAKNFNEKLFPNRIRKL